MKQLSRITPSTVLTFFLLSLNACSSPHKNTPVIYKSNPYPSLDDKYTQSTKPAMPNKPSSKEVVASNSKSAITQSTDDKEDEIVGEGVSKALGEKPVRIPVAKQKRIYYEWTEGYSSLNRAIDKKYGKYYPNNLMSQRREDEKQREERLDNHLMHKYHISYCHLTDIATRGVDKNWPIPNDTDEEDKRMMEIQRNLKDKWVR